MIFDRATGGGFKVHSIAEVNNPYWTMAQPILYEIWADGILKATFRNLYQGIALIFSAGILFFIVGMVFRLLLVILILSLCYSTLCYSTFPQTLSISFDLIFSGTKMSSDLWAYSLLGYAI